MEEEVLKRFGAMLENEYNKYLSASSKKEKENSLYQLQCLLDRPILTDYLSKNSVSSSGITRYGLDSKIEKCIEKIIAEYKNL